MCHTHKRNATEVTKIQLIVEFTYCRLQMLHESCSSYVQQDKVTVTSLIHSETGNHTNVTLTDG